MYSGQHSILQPLDYFIYSHYFVQYHLVACTVGRFVGPDSEVRPRQTRCYVVRRQPANRHSLEQPAKCNGQIIDSKIQASSIYGIQSHMYSTFGDSGVHVEPNTFPFVALAH
jgi:hypothetical protein